MVRKLSTVGWMAALALVLTTVIATDASAGHRHRRAKQASACCGAVGTSYTAPSCGGSVAPAYMGSSCGGGCGGSSSMGGYPSVSYGNGGSSYVYNGSRPYNSVGVGYQPGSQVYSSGYNGYSNGAYQNGAYQNGAYQNGAYQNGAYQNGVNSTNMIGPGVYSNSNGAGTNYGSTVSPNANTGAAIGGAVGGNTGANVGAAIGAATGK